MVLETHYTLKQVADQLQVSVRTVQRWIQEGKLRAIELPSGKYGKAAIRVSASALREVGVSVIDGDRRWEELFTDPRSDKLLDQWAEEVRATRKAGQAVDLDPDTL